jgi:hypothetical protein
VLLIQNLNRIQQMSGFSRFTINSRAAVLGLSCDVRRPWSKEDLLFLRDNLGRINTTVIARKLGRTYYSVKAQVSKLGMSVRLTEGYTHADLQQLLSVSKRRVYKWVQMDWLRMKANRASEASVARFLRSHPGEYVLSRVDEAWFKGLIFPAFNTAWDAGWENKATGLQLDSRYRLLQPSGDNDVEVMQI